MYVKDATINAENTKSLGGLAYRIGGMCEIKSNGVNLEKLIIKAKTDVGLLVCRGEKGKEKIAGKDDWELGALYLYTTNWDNSYRIGNEVNITVTNPGVFDEFVAYTTSKAPEIVDSGKTV